MKCHDIFKKITDSIYSIINKEGIHTGGLVSDINSEESGFVITTTCNINSNQMERIRKRFKDIYSGLGVSFNVNEGVYDRIESIRRPTHRPPIVNNFVIQGRDTSMLQLDVPDVLGRTGCIAPNNINRPYSIGSTYFVNSDDLRELEEEIEELRSIVTSHKQDIIRLRASVEELTNRNDILEEFIEKFNKHNEGM